MSVTNLWEAVSSRIIWLLEEQNKETIKKKVQVGKEYP